MEGSSSHTSVGQGVGSNVPQRVSQAARRICVDGCQCHDELGRDNVDPSLNYGMKIRPIDHPYLLSPPRVPVTGATRTSKDTVKVMAFHGIVYSHQGLSDPATMPEYVRQVREVHCGILRYATVDPELPRWSFIRKGLSSQDWDLGGPTQAYSRPTGREKSMVYNDQTSKWEKAPEPEKLPEPGKGETTEKEANVDTAVQLKRRSETETDEPMTTSSDRRKLPRVCV